VCGRLPDLLAWAIGSGAGSETGWNVGSEESALCDGAAAGSSEGSVGGVDSVLASVATVGSSAGGAGGSSGGGVTGTELASSDWY